MTMRYVDFKLHLSPRFHSIVVSVGAESGSGEDSQESPLTVSAADLERLAAALEAERMRDFDPVVAAAAPQDVAPLLQDVGQRLSETLFPTRVLSRWAATHGTSVHPCRPMRLRLQMDLSADGASLHALPWECVVNPVAGGALARQRDFSLVRYLLRPGADVPPPRPDEVVVLAVAPRCRGLAPLDVEGELAELERALKGRDVRLERLRRPSLDELERRLRLDDVHVVHFIGHSQLDRERRQGVVYFEGEDGAPQGVSGPQLAAALEGNRSLRLLFLNACRTAEAALEAPYAGVATAAIQDAGLAAVIAMQYPIRDRAAVRFAAEVYRRLAEEDDLDRAVVLSRRRLHSAAQQLGAASWMIPVVFSRLPDHRLFAAPQASDLAARRIGRAAAVAAALLVAILTLLGLREWGMQPGATQTDAQAMDGGGVEHQTSLPAPGSGQPRSSPVQEEGGGRETEPVDPLVPSTPPVDHGSRQLAEGRPLYFEAQDAYVSAVFNGVGEQRFVTLNLALGGVQMHPRAVTGNETVRFDTPRGGVALTVLSVDWKRRELLVLPLRFVAN